MQYVTGQALALAAAAVVALSLILIAWAGSDGRCAQDAWDDLLCFVAESDNRLR